MTDDTNADDSTDTERVTFIVKEDQVASGAQQALEAAGVEYDVTPAYAFEIQRRTAQDDDDPSVEELTELAGETERSAAEMVEEARAEDAPGNESASEASGTEQQPDGSTEAGESGNTPEKYDTTADEGLAEAAETIEEAVEEGNETLDDSDEADGRGGDEGNAGSSTGETTTTGSTSDDGGTREGRCDGGAAARPADTDEPAQNATTDLREQHRPSSPGANPHKITRLDNSEDARIVLGALANTNREWATVQELPISNDDIGGYSGLTDVMAALEAGGFVERREIEGGRRGRCVYEQRVQPGYQHYEPEEDA